MTALIYLTSALHSSEPKDFTTTPKEKLLKPPNEFKLPFIITSTTGVCQRKKKLLEMRA